MLAYLERLIVHSFSPINSGTDWRLSHPYQIAFQKVRTKMDSTVRLVFPQVYSSRFPPPPEKLSALPLRSLYSLSLFSLTLIFTTVCFHGFFSVRCFHVMNIAVHISRLLLILFPRYSDVYVICLSCKRCSIML